MVITKKLPIDYKCVILNNNFDEIVEKDFGKNPHSLINKHRQFGLFDFILDKIGKVNFPNYTVYDANYDHEVKTSGKKYSSKQFFVEPQSVIMLPKSYDGVDDKAEFKKKEIKIS